MSDTDEIILDAIIRGLEKHGHDVYAEENTLYDCDDQFSITVLPEDAEENQVGNSITVSVVITTRVIDLPEYAISSVCVGSGRTVEEAVDGVAFRWFACVYHVLCSAFAWQLTESEITPLSMVTRDGETGQPFGWQVYLGNLITMYYGAGGSPMVEEPTETELLKAMLDNVSGIPAHDNPFWLEIFAAKQEDGVTHADCRVNNQLWENGMQALHQYASTWSLPVECTLVSKRQFILFLPESLMQLEGSDEIQQALDQYASEEEQDAPVVETKQPWWHRFMRVK